MTRQDSLAPALLLAGLLVFAWRKKSPSSNSNPNPNSNPGPRGGACDSFYLGQSYQVEGSSTVFVFVAQDALGVMRPFTSEQAWQQWISQGKATSGLAHTTTACFSLVSQGPAIVYEPAGTGSTGSPPVPSCALNPQNGQVYREMSSGTFYLWEGILIQFQSLGAVRRHGFHPELSLPLDAACFALWPKSGQVLP